MRLPGPRVIRPTWFGRARSFPIASVNHGYRIHPQSPSLQLRKGYSQVSYTTSPASDSSLVKKILVVSGIFSVGYVAYLQLKPTSSQNSAEKTAAETIPGTSPLSKDAIRDVLTRNEAAYDLTKDKNSQPFRSVVQAYFNNQVASNNPIEDYHSEHVSSDGKRLIFGVFDGHSGTECANVLSKYLASYIDFYTSKSFSGGASPSSVIQLLKDAFKTFDRQLLKGTFASHPSPSSTSEIIQNLRPAMAGSCALVTVIDGSTLYTACVGDSRAVLGSISPSGELQAIPLSEDQTAQNTAEYRRLLDEHPGEEGTVIHKNRILGSLMPTRAFGDARYKWDAETQSPIYAILNAKRRTPNHYKTPPYVTAEPVVVKHELTERDKFLVLATDGVWDELSNEEVIAAVQQAISGQNKTPSSSTTSSNFNTSSTLSFENPATRIIHTALGGSDISRVGQLLSLPSPLSRRYRDDMTVTVILFDTEAMKEGKNTVSDFQSVENVTSSSWFSRLTTLGGVSNRSTAPDLDGIVRVDWNQVKKKDGDLRPWVKLLERALKEREAQSSS